MDLDEVIERAHEALDDDRAEDASALLAEGLAHDTDAVPKLRAEALGLASIAARAEGRLRDARELSDRALAIAGALAHEEPLVTELLEDRAELELAARAPATAAALLRRAIAMRAQDRREDAETWLALGEALLRGGALEEALSALDRVETLANESKDEETSALAEEMRGDVALAMGDGERARRAYARARAGWAALGEEGAVVRCVVGEARGAELGGDERGVDEAIRVLEEMEEGVEGREEAIEEVRGLR